MTKLHRTFKYHPGAIEDIRQGVLWYRQQSPSSADNFKLELQYAEKLILQSPQVWPVYVHETRRFILNSFPYGLVYLDQGATVIGLAVTHFKRKPTYWQQRIED